MRWKEGKTENEWMWDMRWKEVKRESKRMGERRWKEVKEGKGMNMRNEIEGREKINECEKRDGRKRERGWMREMEWREGKKIKRTKEV